ncbi:MAG: helix-turn-helix domain-containing protein [Hyphomicrobiales bacterium]
MSPTCHSPVCVADFPPRDVRPLWDGHGATRLGPSPKTAQRLCDVVALATAAAFAVPVGELNSASRRSAYVAFARQSAMYLAHVTFGLNYSEVARAFGRDRTTAAHACQLIEERRDDPAIDAVLCSLENACVMLRRRLTAPVQL